MQNISRWIPALAALVLTAACSDSQTATAPMVPAGISAELVYTDCDDELGALRSAIDGARFSGKNAATDEGNLLGKVGAAEAKLAQGKTADAIQKLEDIRATVVALSTAAKPKLDATDADAINEAVDAAEVCIRSLTAT
jgi:hypothetical protein